MEALELASDDNWLRFWSAYPRKQAKADARKAWAQKINGHGPSLERLLTAVQDQCKSEQWQKDGGQYIPLPGSWLRGERWEDVVQIKLPPTPRKKDRYDLANDEFNQRYGVKA